jgi:hypothetical protein
MALTISVLLLLGVILFVIRFVRSRFGGASDLPDSDLPDEDSSDWLDDPRLGSPVRRKGGPKATRTAAEVEEPDES